jgi:predicted nucleic acid-binding protein
MNYFFDSYAIIEVINHNPAYQSFQTEKIVTNALNLGEVYFYFLKLHGQQTADYWMQTLKFELLDISLEAALAASRFRFEHRKRSFSYPDCIGYVTALNQNRKFLTGDREFKGLPNVEFVK